MKYIVNSMAAIKARSQTFRNLQFIPWVNNAGHIAGTQLLLRENEGGEKQAIRLLD